MGAGGKGEQVCEAVESRAVHWSFLSLFLVLFLAVTLQYFEHDENENGAQMAVVGVCFLWQWPVVLWQDG